MTAYDLLTIDGFVGHLATDPKHQPVYFPSPPHPWGLYLAGKVESSGLSRYPKAQSDVLKALQNMIDSHVPPQRVLRASDVYADPDVSRNVIDMSSNIADEPILQSLLGYVNGYRANEEFPSREWLAYYREHNTNEGFSFDEVYLVRAREVSGTLAQESVYGLCNMVNLVPEEPFRAIDTRDNVRHALAYALGTVAGSTRSRESVDAVARVASEYVVIFFSDGPVDEPRLRKTYDMNTPYERLGITYQYAAERALDDVLSAASIIAKSDTQNLGAAVNMLSHQPLKTMLAHKAQARELLKATDSVYFAVADALRAGSSSCFEEWVQRQH